MAFEGTTWEDLCTRYGNPMRYVNDGYLNGSSPVPTNIYPLDNCLSGGMRPGLHVLGGEPGAGKSALGLFITKMSALSGTKAMFASMEMSANQCWARLLSCASLQTGHTFEWGNAWELGAKMRESQADAMRRGELERFIEGFAKTDPVALAASYIQEKCPGLLVVDGGELGDVTDIEAAAENAVGLGLNLLVVDYLQYVPSEGFSDEYGRVSDVSRRLNSLGVRLGIPVLALASNSRQTGKGGGAPSMHSYKGSGDIEYHALSAWVLTVGEDGTRSLHVVKNRFGATTRANPIRLAFDGAHCSFELLEP